MSSAPRCRLSDVGERDRFGHSFRANQWRPIGSSASGHLEGTQNEIGQSADDGGRLIHPAGWLVATPAALRVEGIHADGEAFRTVPLRQWSQRADHIAAISDQDFVSTLQGGNQHSAVPPGCSEFESCAEALRQDSAYAAVSIVSAHRVEILRARHERSSVRCYL